MKVVINRCFGRFSLSHIAVMRYAELKGIKLWPVKIDSDGKATLDETYWSTDDIDRSDPALVQTVEELKELANGAHARIKIVEIPDDVKWRLEDYDGVESIHEIHRLWY